MLLHRWQRVGQIATIFAKMCDLGSRHTLALMAFLCVMNVYFSRLNLSFAIVPMVGSKATKISSDTNETVCAELYDEDSGDRSEVTKGEFDWDLGQLGDLLGSYYYGYVCTQVIGGWLAHKIGFKRVRMTTL